MSDIAAVEKIDRIYDKLFHIGRIQIEKTKTNRELDQIEALYLPKVHNIFRKIVKEYASDFHLLHEAEKRYGLEIRTLIKSMVTKIYLLGIDYVSRATNRQHLVSLSTNDVTQIMIQSNESYKAFWRLVTKYLQVLKNRQIKNSTTSIKTAQTIVKDLLDETDVTITDELFGVSDWEDDRLLDTQINTALIINGIAITILGIATVEKYKEIKAERDLLEQQEQSFMEEYTGELMIPEETYPFDNEGEQAPPLDKADKVIFATEKDDRVCDICSVLEGTEWDIDDPSIVVPRADTHVRCRCRLLLVIDGKVMAR